MVSVERILRDTGSTPERYVFIFDDECVVAVVDVEKLPYHESNARFEAAVTRESFILDGEEISVEELPEALGSSVLSSSSESTHAGDENVDTVPVKYLTTIQNLI